MNYVIKYILHEKSRCYYDPKKELQLYIQMRYVLS